ncbi:FecR family protein [Pleomorphovibrio marinus]|uniref:FecR family protein n=1 Tax=Pleomorphovibrio marinus TaxID=2164132 RepID=UPI000E0BFD93|nr:FecR domain-containing protein [Pleomorphovibrio marinus]
MVKKHLTQLAKKYFSGKLSATEKEKFDSLLDELAIRGNSPSTDESESARAKVLKRLQKARVSSAKPRPFTMLMKYAASLALLGMVVFGLLTFMSQPEAEIAWVEKSTSASMRSTVALTDGSIIRINEKSTLRFPESFGPDHRQVYLEGEAFFDIKPDPKRPFTVYSGNNEITVLGTSFNIHSNGKTEVTVASGKVRVQSPHHFHGVELESGQQAVIAGEGLTIQEVNPEFYLGWMNRKLVFEDEPIENVFHILERAYGVDIKLLATPKSKSCLITGTYEAERIETILKGMEHILDFNYLLENNNKTIKITIKDCK